MDYVTSQLILLLTKAIEKFDTAVDQIRKNNDQQTKIQENSVEKILSARDHSERDRAKREDRQYDIQNSARWATWLTVVVGVGAVVAATWYASITRRMWKEMQAQTKIQRDAGINGERAWVGLEEPISLDAFQLTPKFGVAAHYKIKNFGHGPALKVITVPWVITDFQNLDTERREADFTCDSAKKVSTGTVPMAPNLVNPGPLGYNLFTGQDYADTINWVGDSIPNFRGFQIVVCVGYVDQFRRTRWTRFCMQSPIEKPISKNSALTFCSLYNDTDEPEH